MGLDPPLPPSTCVHLSRTPSPLRVDVINGWPLASVIFAIIKLFDNVVIIFGILKLLGTTNLHVHIPITVSFKAVPILFHSFPFEWYLCHIICVK